MPQFDPSLLSLAPAVVYLVCALPWAARAPGWCALQAGAACAWLLALVQGVAWLCRVAGIDGPGSLMLLLVTTLGLVIVRYSARYLRGEAGLGRYRAALMATLAAVVVVVGTRHLGVLALAWAGAGAGLHVLLTFHGERRAAQLVAHKKFIASRLADACLLVGLALIGASVGDLSLDALARAVAAHETLPAALHGAALLVVLAVALRSAQLPVHGWLIQVMEAPTPVSALLHAGVVNLGGFVLLRLADLLSAAPLAQALLLIIGGTTAALAALVMMTRVSIKVRLAWSTCAQMGFMLVECALGYYELALLHLVAHSAYKAHAFLAAGETVARTSGATLRAPRAAPGVVRQAVAALAGVTLVALASATWSWLAPAMVTEPLAVLVGGFALAPLLWPADETHGLTGRVALAALLALVFLGLHGAAAALWAPPATRGAAHELLVACAALLFVALQVVQMLLLAHPQGAFARRLFPWFYAGFHLDEYFTRLTWRLWPPRLPTSTTAALARNASA